MVLGGPHLSHLILHCAVVVDKAHAAELRRGRRVGFSEWFGQWKGVLMQAGEVVRHVGADGWGGGGSGMQGQVCSPVVPVVCSTFNWCCAHVASEVQPLRLWRQLPEKHRQPIRMDDMQLHQQQACLQASRTK